MASLDEVADELYAGAPADFIAHRDAAAKRARADGDRDLAAEIAALRKPTVSAWLVNLLFHDDDSLAEQIVALGDQLRDAERSLDGPELRSLSKARRDLVRGLVARARALARAEGHRATEATAQEVDATLTAALADPSVAEEVTSGRLTAPREYAGFGSVGVRPDLRVVGGDKSRPVVGRPGVRPSGGRRGAEDGAEPDSPASGRGGSAGRSAGGSADEERAEQERARAEQERRREQERREAERRANEERLRRAEEAWQAAREKSREAAAARDAAADEQRAAAETVRELRGKLAAAEREQASADRALERAEAKEQAARRAVDAATEDVREAEAGLRALPGR